MSTNQFIGKNLIKLESVDSTNNYLSKCLNETNVLNGTVIMAHNQTKGKGQRGNTWESEDGKNLTFSVYLKTDFLSIDKNFLLSMATCNAIHKLVSTKIDNVKIKWPNDILIGNKKLCGILIENSIKGNNLSYSIIGIGLNVNQVKFGDNPNITSLINELGEEQNIPNLLNELLEALERNVVKLKNEEIEELKEYYLINLKGYNSNLEYLNVKTNERFIGKITDVRDNGLVEIETISDEKLVFEMKEISLVF